MTRSMMGAWLLIAAGAIALGATVAILIGRAREKARANRLVASLIRSASHPVMATVDFGSFCELPPVVARYFGHVLTDRQELIRTAKMQQAGVLRASTTAERWWSFTASQLVVPLATGFIWNAKVEMPLGTHVRVLDSYNAGIGSGRVSLLSALAVASESDVPELSSGALHRYLAEAVWYPTALLPQSGITWAPINDLAALATVTDGSTTVSLEFRFNELGEATGIYSSGRFGRFGDGYKQVPWEGHFREYEIRSGMRVPTYGEVGWYDDGPWQAVWKGNLLDVKYEFVHGT